MSKNEDAVPDMPTIALAKSTAEGSTPWLKKQIKEHGDTDPQKLEARRAKLSGLSSVISDGLARMKTEQKANSAKILRDIAVAQEKNESKDLIAQLEEQRVVSDSQYSMLIEQRTVNFAMIEALCLIVDSVTVRDEGENISTGKKGLIRVSAASVADETGVITAKLYRRFKKLYDLLAAANPMVAPKDDDPNDEGEDEIANISDDDIVTREQREEIKKEVVA